jgi:hypothetical protein
MIRRIISSAKPSGLAAAPHLLSLFGSDLIGVAALGCRRKARKA